MSCEAVCALWPRGICSQNEADFSLSYTYQDRIELSRVVQLGNGEGDHGLADRVLFLLARHSLLVINLRGCFSDLVRRRQQEHGQQQHRCGVGEGLELNNT